VKVITKRQTKVHDDYEKQFNCTIKDLGRPRWQAIQIKGRGVSLLMRRFMRRMASWLFEFPNIQLIPLVQKALLGEAGYDLLISIAMPHPVHWGVARAWHPKQPIAETWVADCGDPFMGQENDTFRPPFYFKYVEKWWCRKADFITVPTEESVSAYYAEFKDKIRVIPQGFDFSTIKVKENTIPGPVPEFAYAGSFIPGYRDPDLFIEYLLSLDIDFKFHIYTATPGLVQAIISANENRIKLYEPINRSELLYELSGMDFMVNFENKGARQTPSKLIDYAIIKKPILSIAQGKLDTDLIREFLAGNYLRTLPIDREQYRIEKVTKQFLDLAST